MVISKHISQLKMLKALSYLSQGQVKAKSRVSHKHLIWISSKGGECPFFFLLTIIFKKVTVLWLLRFIFCGAICNHIEQTPYTELRPRNSLNYKHLFSSVLFTEAVGFFYHILRNSWFDKSSPFMQYKAIIKKKTFQRRNTLSANDCVQNKKR